jgi:hypothetical protein
MEQSSTKSGKKGVEKALRTCVSLSLLIALTISSLPLRADEGPSLENLKKNTSAGSKEMEKIKEEEHHKEMMSYVYMSLGFAVVIGIAWGTTIMARNRSRKEAEEKHRFILRQQELKKQHGGHGHLHRARR